MASSRVFSSSFHPYPHRRNTSSFVWRKDQGGDIRADQYSSMMMTTTKTKRKSKSPSSPTPLPQSNIIEKVCKFWASGNCVKGDCCRFLHSWCRGDEVSFLANLQGHKKAVTGIALPSSGAKLYSSSNDGTLRLWDCHTGQCSRVINLGSQVGSLINDGTWVFVGMPNLVKAWNTEKSNNAEFSLNGPVAVGQVNSMIVANGMLLAGTQSGQILAWKGSSDETNPFQPVQSLTGHARAVVCLAFGGNRLFSASLDRTIKVTYDFSHTIFRVFVNYCCFEC
ncbi:Guanine nucleotide-binding protein, beta subunit [Parasponia andersonii]|uniref:Guanine nucleotide-binding protein, beta subunit n=1 Tax=Parasponia andersonii TaxID=3476 RepID=A0A2P5A9K5_PARAD|nr:Guanine nucleotide-binding protein, beta subunit [Parasponia andersonii]